MSYFRLLACVVLCAATVLAQAVISARSGLVNYIEGDVTLAGSPVVVTATAFPQMKEGQELATELGRAEVLLTPGVFLRLSENSRIRMISDDLEDTRLELLAGTALLEAGEISKEQRLVIVVKDRAVEFPKRGLFRLDADDLATVRVFDGQARVIQGDETLTVKEGRIAELGAVASVEKFNKRETDAFHRWASRRSNYVALANAWAAKTIYDRDVSWRVSDWFYNPYFGSFTFLPAGRYMSPFGWSYYSPRQIEAIYRPAPIYNSGPSFDGGMRGWGSMGSGGGRSSSMGTMSSGGSMPAPAPAPSNAPVSSGGRSGGGGARGGGGGR